MGDDTGHSLLVLRGWLFLIVEQVGLTVGDKAPVLHGTSTKVRDRYLIWIKRESTEVTIYHLFYCITALSILARQWDCSLTTAGNIAIKVGMPNFNK